MTDSANSKIEQHCSAMIVHIPIAVYVYNKSGQLIMGNESVEELTGYSMAYLKEHGFANTLLLPDDYERFEGMISSCIEGGGGIGEFALSDRGGDEKIVEIAHSPLIVDQKIEGVLGLIKDITAEKQALKNLKESEERWFNLLDSSPQAAQISKQGRIVYVNKAAADLYGADDPEQLVGKSLEDFSLPQNRQQVQDRLAKLEAEQFIETGEINIRSLNGEVKTISTHSIPVQFNGESAIQTIIQDLTQRREMEKELVDSEERYNLAVRGVAAGLWDWQDIGLDTEREWWSPRFYKLLGYEPGEVEASLANFQEMLHPEDVQATFDEVDRHFTNRDIPFRKEYRLMTKSGQYRWFLGTGQAAFGPDGTPRRMVGSIVDIDQERRLLETRNKLYSIIGHDLKNAFFGISGLTEITLQDLEGSENGLEISQNMELIHQTSVNTLRLLENLLDWARIQTGNDQFEPEKRNVAEVVQDAIEVLDSSAIKKNIEIDTNLDPEVEALIEERMIGTIARNLLTNAIKFTKPGGRISVELKHVDQNGEWNLKIIDNGSGMPEEVMKNLFAEDNRPIRGGTSREKGTGLGLLLCKEMVELHRGTISVESTDGVGSEFSITIPLDPGAAGSSS